MIVVDKTPGFDFNKFFQTWSFNMVSRLVGAGARSVLLFAGTMLIFVGIFAGSLVFVIWLILPPLSLSYYFKYKRQPSEYMKDLYYKMKLSKSDPLDFILQSEAGLFLTEHLGVDAKLLRQAFSGDTADIASQSPFSFTKLIEYTFEKDYWNQDSLRKLGIIREDFVNLSVWWDKKREDESYMGNDGLGRPGIAIELLFGYTPTLNQFSVDLSAPQSFSHRLIGREDVVSRMERELSSGNSVVLTGDPGVGKKTVVLEFAHKAASGVFGSRMAYKRVLEFDYNVILSEGTDINQKKVKFAQVLEEAAYAGNIILMIRDMHRLVHPDVEGYDFTNTFEESLEKGNLKIIAVATPIEFERFIAPNARLRKHLQRVQITPPSKEMAMEILLEVAKNLEVKTGKVIEITALRKILDESDRYITETPFPEKALELLEAVMSYVEGNNKTRLTGNEVNEVFAEKTGISLTKMTADEKTKLTNLEDIIHEKLIDQEMAVKLIAQSLRAKTVGVTDSNRPMGSFLFLGPTGVGKTETAKVLAKVYYGNEDSILRFDMAEYAGAEGLERLVGSVTRNYPGAMTTAIRNKPASLLLLDEFEKATREVFNLFLTVLDEGYLTDAFGKRIVARNLFVICTSNAGAEYIRQSVSKGMTGPELQKELVNYVLEKGIFTPELINRFDGVIVYQPLGENELRQISKLMLDSYAKQLKNKGIILEVTQELIDKLAVDGYDPAFGARPMRRIVDLIFGDLVGTEMLAGRVKDGSKIQIEPGAQKEQYSVRVLE